MTDRDTEHDARMLEQFFEAARRESAEASPALMGRVLQDAYAAQGRAADERVVRPARRGRLARLVEMLGGWPAVAGLTAATMAGLWIGVSQTPALLTYVGYAQAGEALYQVDFSDETLLALHEGAL